MKKKNMQTEKRGYLRNISFVWDLKEAAYIETQNLSYQEIVNYIQKDIKIIREKDKNQMVQL